MSFGFMIFSNLLDINYYKVPPKEHNEQYSLYEYAEYDIDYYSVEISELRILPRKIFKLIAIKESTINYTYTLKLRDTGDTV